MKRSTSGQGTRLVRLVALMAAAALVLGACGDDDEQGLSIDSGTPQDDGSSGSGDDGTDAGTACREDDGSVVVDGTDTDIEIGDDGDVSVDGDDNGDDDGDDDDSSIVVNGNDVEVRTGDDGSTIEINGNTISLDDLDACTGGEDGDDDGGNRGNGNDDDDDDDESGDGTASGTLTSSGDYRCDGSDVSIDGVSLNVDLIGACGTVNVNGNDNNVNIEQATTVNLNGAQHNVDVLSADEINLSGADHNLNYSGSPTVNDSSVESSIN